MPTVVVTLVKVNWRIVLVFAANVVVIVVVPVKSVKVAGEAGLRSIRIQVGRSEKRFERLTQWLSSSRR
jgi:hypothetical protein